MSHEHDSMSHEAPRASQHSLSTPTSSDSKSSTSIASQPAAAITGSATSAGDRRSGSRGRALGWSSYFEPWFASHAEAGRGVGRVLLSSRGHYRLGGDFGERPAELAGRLRQGFDAPDGAENLPAIGDWVVFDGPSPGEPMSGDGPLRIVEVLPRRSQLSRKVAGGRTREQVVAANVDTVFVVMGLDGDYNPRRLERFLTMIWDSGASPVVLLNKTDLADDPEGRLREIETRSPGVPVHGISALSGGGTEGLGPYLEPGRTVVLVGSSGVGKSTLVNRLCGREVVRTGAVREGDDRGRHTTTHRQLVELPGGALLIDNPGIRELQLWVGEEGLSQTFDEIRRLAEDCRYRDCSHHDEPGCAVLAAIDQGALDPERLGNLHALEREQRHLELKVDEHARRKEKKRIAAIHKAAKLHKPRYR